MANYLCFTAVDANATVMQNIGKTGCSYQYSFDGNTWNNVTLGVSVTLENIGDKVYWKGNGISNSTSNPIFILSAAAKVAASGSVMSLIDGTGEGIDLTGNNFYLMFCNCKSLVTAPELPATTLADSCYYAMFQRCTSLVEAPKLPATTLAEYCYARMFQGCTSLTKAPKLPATTLTTYCYGGMFYGCTSLTTAPELPATELANDCYKYMFYLCSNLNYIKVDAISWNENASEGWTFKIAESGAFECLPGLLEGNNAIPLNSVSGIPTGWAIQIINPEKLITLENLKLFLSQVKTKLGLEDSFTYEGETVKDTLDELYASQVDSEERSAWNTAATEVSGKQNEMEAMTDDEIDEICK